MPTDRAVGPQPGVTRTGGSEGYRLAHNVIPALQGTLGCGGSANNTW
jgi:hypothetical protein